MNRISKQIIQAVLSLIVIIELIILNIGISDWNEYRNHKVPKAKKNFDNIQEYLKQIDILKNRSGGTDGTAQGPIETSEINKIAKQAGITSAPVIRSGALRGRSARMGEISSEIKVYKVSSESMFDFLNALEERSGTGRIKTLSIGETRGEANIFDLTIQYSTFNPGSNSEKTKKNSTQLQK